MTSINRIESAIEEKAAYVARLLGLMANEKRLLLLCRLAEGEMSVSHLARVLGLGQSALSQHLSKLREEGLVDSRREGQSIFYRIGDPKTLSFMETLQKLYCN